MYKHPKALFFLFFAEMWERFSFYGMRALLTLYLTLQLFKDLQDPAKKLTAYGIYAAYGALVYATPFIGGLIADKILGHKKSVIWGAILMAIGHFIMAIESQFWLYIALSFLILGNGFFKPNISSIVGELYEKNDPRRDGGFTIFYMGVNLGAFLSPLVCGTIGEMYGWHYGFGIAGVGMLAGLFVFIRNKQKLDYREHIQNNEVIQKHHPLGEPPHPNKLAAPLFLGLNLEHIVYICSIISIALFAVMVKNYEYMSYVLTPFAIIVFVILLVIAFRSEKVERERMFVVLILLLFTTLFWAFFEQAGSSLTLFANENINRNLGSMVVPASLFQSVNPFFIIVFASPFTFMWLWLSARKKEPSTPQKFALGIFLLSLGFLLLAIAPMWVSQNKLLVEQGGGTVLLFVATVPMIVLVVSYLFQTLGELCLSPIGLSMVTKLVSPKIVGMVLGAWFLSSAMAHHIAGIIANATTEQESTVEVMMDTFTNELPESCFIISKEKFVSIHESNLKEGFHRINGQILEQASVPNKSSIAKESVVTSTMKFFEKNHVLREVNDTARFRSCLIQSVYAGVEHMKKVGDAGVKKAIQEEYISKEQSQKFTYSTRYSLANMLNYTNVFYVVGIIALLASLLLFIMSPMITKMMHGV